MSEYTIEKDIPIPKKPGMDGRPSKYPWALMEVGDSFFVPEGSPKSLSSMARVSGKRVGKKFGIRTVEGGVRVWRLA